MPHRLVNTAGTIEGANAFGGELIKAFAAPPRSGVGGPIYVWTRIAHRIRAYLLHKK